MPKKRAIVTIQKKAALRVQTDGKRHHIDVPVDRAWDLHNYLRSNQVRSSPPEPAWTGFDSIKLAKDIDVAAI
jgi:hypothetical protein